MSVRLVDNKDTLKKVNDWRDPLYLNNLLTDKEKLIHKKAKVRNSVLKNISKLILKSFNIFDCTNKFSNFGITLNFLIIKL